MNPKQIRRILMNKRGKRGWIDDNPGYLRDPRGLFALESVLVHYPVGALALGRASGVEDERLLHPDDPGPMAHLPVLAGGLPVPPGCGAVGAGAVGVLAVEAAEEVPLGVAGAEAGAGGEVPGLELVEVDLGDGVDAEAAAEDAAAEVVGDELLVGGVEAEPRGQFHGLVQLLLHRGASWRRPCCCAKRRRCPEPFIHGKFA